MVTSILLFAIAVPAQTKKPKKKVVTTAPVPAATPEASPQTPVEIPVKRNERPTDTKADNTKLTSRAAAYTPVYFYEFDRPGFTYPRILIEHDEAGKGKISFLKDGYGELLTDPIELSDVTIFCLSRPRHARSESVGT